MQSYSVCSRFKQEQKTPSVIFENPGDVIVIEEEDYDLLDNDYNLDEVFKYEMLELK